MSALGHLHCSVLCGSTFVADDGLLRDTMVAFADGATAHRLRALDLRAMVVEVVPHGETTAGIEPVLTMPFEVGELESLLDRALESFTTKPG